VKVAAVRSTCVCKRKSREDFDLGSNSHDEQNEAEKHGCFSPYYHKIFMFVNMFFILEYPLP